MKPLLAPFPPANLVWLGEADSTNEVAARIMAIWAAEEVEERLTDTVVVAAAQTAGRGRGPNVWQSPLGGVYATWLGWLASEALTWLPMAAGVALAEAIEAACPMVSVSLKWPNDIVVGGGKLAGILAQSRISGDEAWAIVGFGVNVEVEPSLPTGDSVRPVALRTLGYPGTADKVAWRLVDGFLGRLRPALGSPDDTRERWIGRSVHRAGEKLRVRLPGEEIVGTFAGFGPEGQLLVTTAGGNRAIAAGEIVPPMAGEEV